MSILAPKNDTLISMARLVHEKSELNFLNVSFSIEDQNVVVTLHDDVKETAVVYEKVAIAELLISYIGLGLVTDLEANDKVTTGHRLNKNR